MDSILNSVKKLCGVGPTDTSFDIDILMHINSVLSVLHQLGIGPAQGFMVEDDTETWQDFIGQDKHMNLVKSYVYLRVRLLFDPPTTSYLIAAFQEERKELEWRLNVVREHLEWSDPFKKSVMLDGSIIIDAGTIG